MMIDKLVTIFGGSGFIGRHLVKKLANKGFRIRVAVRNPHLAGFLKIPGKVGQIELHQSNIRDKESIDRVIQGSDIVVNLVGIISETSNQKFNNLHISGIDQISKLAKKNNVRKLIHLSAIGANINSSSRYAFTKGKGEIVLRKNFASATIIRPSIVFGPEDKFFNRFAGIARLSPFLPLFGGGKSKFQPVYVEDLCDAIIKSAENSSLESQIIELGGPQIYDFKQLMEILLKTIKRKRILISLPIGVAYVTGFLFNKLPNPLLTIDQVRLLETDNIVSKENLTFADLGIEPKSLVDILPDYLYRYRREGQFS